MSTIDRGTRRSIARGPRAVAAGLLSTALLAGATGCGFDAQTLQPYTPSEGVNVDIGAVDGRSAPVKVRALVVVAESEGEGYLSAQIVSDAGDQLTSVTGTALGVEGDPVGRLDIALPGPMTVPAGGSVVLVDQPLVSVEGDGLVAGLTTELTLTFQQAGEATLQVPVVDGDSPGYDTVSPVPPTPSPSASATGR